MSRYTTHGNFLNFLIGLGLLVCAIVCVRTMYSMCVYNNRSDRHGRRLGPRAGKNLKKLEMIFWFLGFLKVFRIFRF